VPLVERDYFKEPFTEAELRSLLGDRPATDFFSWRSPTARALGLAAKKSSLSNDNLIRLMIEEPNLIRRPLFEVDGQLVAGFDPAAREQLSKLVGAEIPAPKKK